MSNFRTLAFSIKDHLESEIPELAGRCVVFRHSDIESQFETAMGKSTGKCVIIRVLSAKNESKTKTSIFAGNLSVALFTVPLLTQKDAKDADALIAEIEAALNYWWPSSVPSNLARFLKSDSLTYPEDREYDIALLTLKTPAIPLKSPATS